MIRPDIHARFESIREKVDREVEIENRVLANLRGTFTRDTRYDDDALYSVGTDRRKRAALQRSRSRGGLRARGTMKRSR